MNDFLIRSLPAETLARVRNLVAHSADIPEPALWAVWCPRRQVLLAGLAYLGAIVHWQMTPADTDEQATADTARIHAAMRASIADYTATLAAAEALAKRH